LIKVDPHGRDSSDNSYRLASGWWSILFCIDVNAERPCCPDDPVDQFTAVVKLLVRGEKDRARAAMLALDLGAIDAVRRTRAAEVAACRVRVPSRTAPAIQRRTVERDKLAVFARDRWTCRVCGSRTLDLRVLKLVSRALPVEFPYHSNWKFGHAHLIYWTRSSSLEHVVPLARGGTDELSNLVTTCYSCNAARSHYLLEEIGWTLRAPASSTWRGLTEYLASLRVAAAEEPTPPDDVGEPATGETL
jgi:5-methylcytosine-specific restriction endonuclease McrA